MKAFESAARRVADKPIEFSIDGDEYHFKPPASMSSLVLSTTGYFDEPTLKVQLDWLGAGLPEDESERIKKRLLDPNDDLDTVKLLEVVNWIIEEMTGRPTSPSDDS